MSKAVSNLGTDAGTNKVSEGLGDYVIRVVNSPLELDANQWNALLAAQDNANLFMRHEYLAAMTTTGCAVPDTGWTPCFVTIWQDAIILELSLRPEWFGYSVRQGVFFG